VLLALAEFVKANLLVFDGLLLRFDRRVAVGVVLDDGALGKRVSDGVPIVVGELFGLALRPEVQACILNGLE